MKGTSPSCVSVWSRKPSGRGDRGLPMTNKATEAEPQENPPSAFHPAPNSSVTITVPSKMVVSPAKLLRAAWSSLGVGVTSQGGLLVDVKPQEQECGLNTGHTCSSSLGHHVEIVTVMLHCIQLLSLFPAICSFAIVIVARHVLSDCCRAEMMPSPLLSKEH